MLQVKKVDLEKRKNDDEQEEGWVQCDLCSAWVHMICGLFNKGRNTDEMPYHCPECLLGGEVAFAGCCWQSATIGDGHRLHLHEDTRVQRGSLIFLREVDWLMPHVICACFLVSLACHTHFVK